MPAAAATAKKLSVERLRAIIEHSELVKAHKERRGNRVYLRLIDLRLTCPNCPAMLATTPMNAPIAGAVRTL